jgi:uncharacterized protein
MKSPNENPESRIMAPEILGDVGSFLEKTFFYLDHDGIDVSSYELDHLCYRVDSKERYQKLQAELSRLGTLLNEAEINGRKISTYKLTDPILFNGRQIFLVELPSPKDGSPYPEGLEHSEFVIPERFGDFMKRHPSVPFDLSDIQKKSNPDIKIKYDGFSVKFHNKSLEMVIKTEQK